MAEREQELTSRLEQAVLELKVEREMRDNDRRRVAELEQKLLTGDLDPDEAQVQLMERVEDALTELENERLQRDSDRHRVAEIEKRTADEQAKLASLRSRITLDEEKVQSHRLDVSAKEDELSTLQMTLAQKEMELTRIREEVEIEQHAVSSQMEQLGSGQEKLKSDWQRLDTERDNFVSQNHNVSQQARDLAQQLEDAIEQLQLERQAREADRSQLYEIETRCEAGQRQLQQMRQQLSVEKQKLVARQRKLAQKETEIKGVSKSLDANRKGLQSQITVMTERIEHLLSERDDLDGRQEELTHQLEETDDAHIQERLQMALEELQYEQRARHLERQQLAQMVQQFSNVKQQLSQLQQSVGDLAEDNTGSKQTIDLDFDLNEALTSEPSEEADHWGLGETETARLEGQFEEIEVEVESLLQERGEIAQQKEETEEALSDLLEAMPTNKDDPWDVADSEVEAEAEDAGSLKADVDEYAIDSAGENVKEQLSSWKSRKKSRRKTKKLKVALSDLAEAAQDADAEEEQLQAFRSMLGSMFGMKKPGDELVDEPAPIENPQANSAINDEGLSVEEPVIIQEPPWARNVTPMAQEVDRSSVRDTGQKASKKTDDRHTKNRDLARRMAMTSLREVANQSARNALAEHTQRKLKRKMWINGSLACISMGLGGAFLSQNFNQGLSWRTCGGVAVIIGVIAIVEMFRTFIRWQWATAMRKSGARRTRQPSYEDRYARQTPEIQPGPTTTWPPHPQHSHQPVDYVAEVTQEATSTVANVSV